MSDDASMTDILVAIARLETKVDNFNNNQRNLDRRVEKLEAARWPVQGVTALTAVTGTALGVWSLVRGG